MEQVARSGRPFNRWNVRVVDGIQRLAVPPAPLRRDVSQQTLVTLA